jgi:signal transduction histidine kinase
MMERIRAAGGDVELTSAPGRGTRVAFSVPLSLART